MSQTTTADWDQHPVYQALNGIAVRLRAIQQQRKALNEVEEDARTAIKQGLNTYFSACAEQGVDPKHRIDMLDGTELVINEDWYDMQELKAVTLQEAPKCVISIVRDVFGKEGGES